jgi:hypothetical protein
MTLVEKGAEELIGMFGEEVTITPSGGQTASDNDTIYLEPGSDGTPFTHKVRLYSAPSEETLQKYGFEPNADAMMYETDGVAEQSDTVEFSGDTYTITSVTTNQLGDGPYIYIYGMSKVK